MRAPKVCDSPSWSPSHNPKAGGGDPTRDLNTSELLKWISDVTIKRRQIRKATRCSNLRAEAILSSSLKKARRDLAVKQEEKRRKLQLFTSRLQKKYSPYQDEEEDIYDIVGSNSNNSRILAERDQNSQNAREENRYKLTVTTYSWQDRPSSDKVSKVNNSNDNNHCDLTADEDMKDCLASLDNFFNELKSVKV